MCRLRHWLLEPISNSSDCGEYIQGSKSNPGLQLMACRPKPQSLSAATHVVRWSPHGRV